MEPVTTPPLFYLFPLLIAWIKTHGFLFLSGMSFYGVARKWVSKKFANPYELAGISLVAGALMSSWIFVQALRLFPMKPPEWYLYPGYVTVGCLGLFGLVYFVKDVFAAGEDDFEFDKTRETFKFEKKIAIAAGIFALSILGIHSLMMVWTTMLTPFSANDALEYAHGGKMIANARDMSIYPFVNSEVTGGFYGAWTHPPGYLGLMSWAYMANDGADIGMRLVSIYFVITSLFAVWSFGVRYSPLHGLFGLIFAVFAPYLYVLGVISHIDPIRIAGFSVAALAIFRLMSTVQLRDLLFCAFVLGLAQFTHSIGILSSFLILPAFFICAPVSFFKKIYFTGLLFVTSLILIVPDLIKNWMTFGSFIQDHVLVWGIKELEVQALRDFNRQLSTIPEKIYYGLLKGFSFRGAFGRSYQLFALVFIVVSAFILWRDRGKFFKDLLTLKVFYAPNLQKFALLIIAGFYAMVLLTMFGGSDLIIKNARYFLTVQYLIAIFTGFVLAEIVVRAFTGDRFKLFEFIPDNNWARAGIAIILILCVMPAVGYGNLHHKRAQSQEFGKFNMVSATKFDSYHQKMLASGAPNYHAVWYLNKLHDSGALNANEKVLTFRKAETAKYANFEFRTYNDDKLIKVFTSKTKDEALSVLENNNIRYISIPAYPMAEVNNSQVGKIIGDPNYAELAFHYNGARVFKTLTPKPESISSVEPNVVLSLDTPQYIVASKCPLFADVCENRTFSDGTYAIHNYERELLGKPKTSGAFAWGTLHYLNLNMADNDEGRVTLEPGTYRLNSNMEANAFVRVLLLAHAKNASKSDADLRKSVLWSGLLSKPKELQAQFEILPALSQYSEWRKDIAASTEYSVAIELVGQGHASILDLKIEKVSDALTFYGNKSLRLQSMAKNHWSIETSKIDPVLLIPADTDGLGAADENYSEAVNIQSIDSRPVQVFGPKYRINPNDLLDSYGIQSAGVLSNTPLGALTKVLGYSVKLNFSGQGLINMGIEYQCPGVDPSTVDFGWFIAQEFEKQIERDFSPSCDVSSWRPYMRTSQSLMVYGPGYQPVDIKFNVAEAKGYISDSVSIKQLDLVPRRKSNNPNYAYTPTTLGITRPLHPENEAALRNSRNNLDLDETIAIGSSPGESDDKAE